MGWHVARKRQRVAHKARRHRSLFVVASLVLHAAILGPLALGTPGDNLSPQRDGAQADGFLPVDVILVRGSDLPRIPFGTHATLTPDTADVTRPVPSARQSSPANLFRAGRVGSLVPEPGPALGPSTPQSGIPAPGDGAIDGLSGAWRARANALASGPVRAGPDCRRAEILPPVEREVCARRFAVDDAAVATARLGQRRLTRTESAREDGFVEQAAANEAWSAYRRGEGSYPGLRSMLKHF